MIYAMKLKRNLALNDSGFVFDPSTGDSFSTNAIGLEIIHMIKEGKTPKHIQSKIIEKYTVDTASVERDYCDFIKILKEYNLIEDGEKG
jgi:Coenzyme PQQ synthesis protein D (PqqD)